MSKATHLECSICKQRFEAGTVQNLCSCGGPLLVRYDLDTIRLALAQARCAEWAGHYVAVRAGSAGG